MKSWWSFCKILIKNEEKKSHLELNTCKFLMKIKIFWKHLNFFPPLNPWLMSSHSTHLWCMSPAGDCPAVLLLTETEMTLVSENSFFGESHHVRCWQGPNLQSRILQVGWTSAIKSCAISFSEASLFRDSQSLISPLCLTVSRLGPKHRVCDAW